MERVFTTEEIFRGDRFRLLVLHRGDRCMALDFLRGLQPRDRLRVRRLLKRIADYGCPHNEQKWRALKGAGNLFEIKSGPARLFCFFDERATSLVITNGCLKRRDAADPREIARARGLRDGYLAEEARRRHERT
jgi:mRNA-degrading endonuclease RelE of RelBE toxin-antitoxin system